MLPDETDDFVSRVLSALLCRIELLRRLEETFRELLGILLPLVADLPILLEHPIPSGTDGLPKGSDLWERAG